MNDLDIALKSTKNFLKSLIYFNAFPYLGFIPIFLLLYLLSFITYDNPSLIHAEMSFSSLSIFNILSREDHNN